MSLSSPIPALPRSRPLAPPRLVTETLDPSALSAEDQQALIDELYPVHDAIFSGVDREAFAAYVVRSPAAHNRLLLVRCGAQVVGYAALHAFWIDADGPALVLRGEVGLLPAFRRRTLFGWFFAREIGALRLRHPCLPMWIFACPVNPATYRMLSRYAPVLHPHWSQPTPDAVQAWMEQLADRFGLPRTGSDPAIRDVGWATRETPAERRAWRDSAHPATRLYLERNPSYPQGHGMLILIPVDLARVASGIGRLVAHQLRRRLGSWLTTSAPEARQGLIPG